jgi:hypothetical protein
MLPELYNPNIQRNKDNLHNHVPEDIRAEFMRKCFLPAVTEILNHHEKQSWTLNYDVADANSTASSKEGNRSGSSKLKSRRQAVESDLNSKYIEQVWRICERRLRREIKRERNLKAFRGFQFFINAKKYKYRMHINDFSQLMQIYKEKVSMIQAVSLTGTRQYAQG